MGSLDGRSEHEFEDESLVSPVTIARKAHSLGGSHLFSFSSSPRGMLGITPMAERLGYATE
ncbi:Vacuolar cation proton exchanger [Asimina triloba]